MAGLVERFNDWFSRKEREAAALRDEYDALEDELKDLRNEARFQEEPAFLAFLQRQRDELERQTRDLIYESREPNRSQLQGRCQTLLEAIERPAAVSLRLGVVQERLRELRERSLVPDDGDTVERGAAA